MHTDKFQIQISDLNIITELADPTEAQTLKFWSISKTSENIFIDRVELF